ncbi:hypothetical protein KGF56_000132 [Candida oxycetoniae]|uniref:Uncharacterized protein n=1 Tax=Candida oxycetoniae TaxID=497107 RepID=A0AAI9X0D6_9ASCO|nr:uncharacterized protein KGF56_000132 [Candida oxycetoniae]KAI3407044.2 hypothetical protein KGF56_000132 [Candida oxycetoniae]
MPSTLVGSQHLQILPTQRIYDVERNRIIQRIKFQHLPNNLFLQNNKKVKVNVKISAFSFPQDFHESFAFCRKQNKSIIPGKRIVVKQRANPTRYAVYPYTNCQLEQLHQSKNGSECECRCDLVYGIDIDGGLQNSLLVPQELLIPIPKIVSLHDVCFLWDILLPFYVHYKSVRNKYSSFCIILNDLKKELNEVLIVLNHFGTSKKKISIIDGSKVNRYLNKRYQCVFCFDSKLLPFAESVCTGGSISISSSGYYSLYTNFPIVSRSSDKPCHQMRLTYENKSDCIELLGVMAELNTSRKNAERDSMMATTESSGDDELSSSSLTSSNMSLKSKHNKHSEHVQPSQHGSDSHSDGHYSWIWCDDDVDLTNLDFNDLSIDDVDDYDKRERKSLRQMNRNLRDGKPHRICYFNRRRVKKELNACII